MGSYLQNRLTRTILLLALVIFIAFGSILFMGKVESARAVDDETYKLLDIFNQALDLVEKNYVKEVDRKTLVEGAIKGMLSNLDPHSTYISPQEFADIKSEISGQFGGLGIEVGIRDEKLIVIAPIEDTPAWRAGLRANDWIVKIDGTLTQGMALMDAVHKMRGKKGTQVTLTIMREGWKEPKDFVITRDIIKLKSVKRAELIEGKYGYIRLVTFNESTISDLKEAMKKLSGNKGLAGLVLDLRFNPGGPLTQAVEVAELFLSEGPIVTIKGKNQQDNKTWYAHPEGSYTNFPMIVLINGASASASEIVAGALRDSGRALLMGTRSYGKGSVQSLYTLKDNSGIKLTTAYYYTPSGKSIQEQGIEPDIVIEELSPEQEEALEKQREEKEKQFLREENLEKHIEQKDVDTGLKKGVTPEEKEQRQLQEPFDYLKDYQLRRAIELLKSWEIFKGVETRKGSVK